MGWWWLLLAVPALLFVVAYSDVRPVQRIVASKKAAAVRRSGRSTPDR